MPPRRLPPFVAELIEAPAARHGLIAGTVALVAAGLDPKVWGPTLPSVQAAVREQPQLEVVIMLMALASAGLLLIGGAVGDTLRARPIIIGGLLVQMAASVVALIVASGPLFVASRFLGTGAAAFVIPVSIALVATRYTGVARATAIGIAYGAFGAAAAAAPILLQVIPDQRAPAFLVSILACAVAIWLARGRIGELPRPTTPERPYVVGTAIWAFGIITVTVGLTWVGGGLGNPIRWLLVAAGFVTFGVAVLHDRRQTVPGSSPVRIDRRPVAAAIFVGIVLAVSQTAAMLTLPIFFRVVLGFGPLLAVVGLAPLFGALAVAGPVAGFLLSRYTPRMLVGAGVVAVGLANTLLWLVTTSSSDYLAFIVPCFLVGAGFVIATTVRTAIIFASVPRGLPATAAALNESSITVGSRVGVVFVTAIVAQTALSAYAESIAGMTPADADQALAAFRQVLVAVGTPAFSQIAGGISPADVEPYIEAYLSGLRAAFGFSALIALIGGAVVWIALGRRDPLTIVYTLKDERA